MIGKTSYFQLLNLKTGTAVHVIETVGQTLNFWFPSKHSKSFWSTQKFFTQLVIHESKNSISNACSRFLRIITIIIIIIRLTMLKTFSSFSKNVIFSWWLHRVICDQNIIKRKLLEINPVADSGSERGD